MVRLWVCREVLPECFAMLLLQRPLRGSGMKLRGSWRRRPAEMCSCTFVVLVVVEHICSGFGSLDFPRYSWIGGKISIADWVPDHSRVKQCTPF